MAYFIQGWQKQLLEQARNPDLPNLMRLEKAVLAMSDDAGHAQFPPSGLAQILCVVDRKTGEVRPMSRYQVRDLLQKAKELGLITQDSTARCVRRPEHVWTGGRPGSGRRECHVHKAGGRDYSHKQATCGRDRSHTVGGITPTSTPQNPQQDAKSADSPLDSPLNPPTRSGDLADWIHQMAERHKVA